MDFRSLLLHVDHLPDAAARIALAVHLALACGAHLTAIACTGVSRFAQNGPTAPQVPEHLQHWRSQARSSLANFATMARAAGLHAMESRLAEDTPDAALLRLAPCCDLFILGQHAPGLTPSGALRNLPQEVLLHGARPVLLVPHPAAAGTRPAPLHHALVAWDGSLPAARAISAALPLLKLAPRTTLLVLNPHLRSGTHGAEPGADMALLMTRHGVRTELVRECTAVDIGAALLGAAAERHCDLLVMGLYGHRRSHDMLLGGASRTVLRDMTLPVLMAH